MPIPPVMLATSEGVEKTVPDLKLFCQVIDEVLRTCREDRQRSTALRTSQFTIESGSVTTDSRRKLTKMPGCSQSTSDLVNPPMTTS